METKRPREIAHAGVYRAEDAGRSQKLAIVDQAVASVFFDKSTRKRPGQFASLIFTGTLHRQTYDDINDFCS
jgi:hypothetical protein